MNKILTVAMMTFMSYSSAQTVHFSPEEIYERFYEANALDQEDIQTSIRDFFTPIMNKEHLYFPGHTPSEQVSAKYEKIVMQEKPDLYRQENVFLRNDSQDIHVLQLEDLILYNYKSTLQLKFQDGGDTANAFTIYYNIQHKTLNHSVSETIHWEGENILPDEERTLKINEDLLVRRMQALYGILTRKLLTSAQ
jgi:hypothetical protein